MPGGGNCRGQGQGAWFHWELRGAPVCGIGSRKRKQWGSGQIDEPGHLKEGAGS